MARRTSQSKTLLVCLKCNNSFPNPPYRAWHLELKVKNLLGSVPANADQLQYWARERKKQFPYLDDKALEEMVSEVMNELRMFPAEAEEVEGLNIHVFRRNAKGRYIEYYHIVGWLYEAAAAQGLTRTLTHFKLSTWAVGPNGSREIVVLPAEKVRDPETGEERAVIQKLPIEMRVVRAITARGPRQALVFHEIIEGPVTIQCDVYTTNPKLTDDIMEMLVEVGKNIGLGPGRTHGYGKVIEAKVEPLQPER